MKYNKIYLFAIIYKVIFEWIYWKFVTPQYDYMGLIWNPNINFCYLSYLLFFLLLFLLPKKKERPSHQLAQLFFFTTVIPLLSFYWLTSSSTTYMVLIVSCFGLLSIILRYLRPFSIPLLTFEGRKSMSKIINYIFLATIILLTLFTVKYGGIDLRTLNFEQIYDLREEKIHSGIWGYIESWLGKFFIPICIITYLLQKRKILFTISSLMQIYLYMSTGSKTYLFSVIFIVFCIYLLKSKRWEVGIPQFYTIVIVLSTIFYLITKNLWSLAIFPVRQLVIPAQISFAHYDFFSVNPKLYFSEGIIGKIIGTESPYNTISTFMIGDGRGNWNTGYLGDAYDNGGFILMVVYTIIFAMILLFVDSVSRFSKKRYQYTALLAYSIIVLNDGALLTTLLTSGMVFTLIFIYFAASEEYHVKSKRPIVST